MEWFGAHTVFQLNRHRLVGALHEKSAGHPSANQIGEHSHRGRKDGVAEENRASAQFYLQANREGLPHELHICGRLRESQENRSSAHQTMPNLAKCYRLKSEIWCVVKVVGLTLLVAVVES